MNRVWLLLAMVCLATACNFQETNTTMWPSHAMRGQTVALPIDSNHVYRGLDQWDLSKENLEIEIDWGSAGPPDIVTIGKNDGLRVIEAWSHPSAVIDSILAPPFDTRAWIAIAVFPVPDDTVITTAPVTATVRPLKDGNPIVAYPAQGPNPPVYMEATLEILAGTPSQVLLPDPEDLEPPPLLRVAGVAGQAQFDPEWFDKDGTNDRLIGSMEFELAYPGTLTFKDAYPISDAAAGTILVGPGSVANRAKIVLIDPKGFVLAEEPVGRPGIAGDGPFLDIAFEAGPFQESDFTFHDLVVADTDGNALIEAAGPASGYFDLYIRGPRP